MGVIFSDLSQRRNELLHTTSVWQEVVEHLSKFVGSDAAPPKYGITTKGEGMTVPPEIVESVVLEVQDKISKIAVACTEIEQTIMEDRSVGEKQAGRKEEATRREEEKRIKERAPSKERGGRGKAGKGKSVREKGRLRVVREAGDGKDGSV